MRRRTFLGIGIAVATTACGPGFDTPIPIQTPIAQRKTVQVQTPIRITQDCETWCWAASIAMIFADNKHPVIQERIVQTVFQGGLYCTSQGPSTVTALLNSSWIDEYGFQFRSRVTAGYDYFDGILAINNNVIINELAAGRPLLYANTHHAMVVVYAEYMDSPTGAQILNIGVMDPWPGSPGYHYLEQQELIPAHLGGQFTYIASVLIS